MVQSMENFSNQLDMILDKSEKLGLFAVEVNSGNLHRQIGGYPSSDHRMPICCKVMYDKMKTEDSVITKPKSGFGASVVIRYVLPR